MQPLLRSNAAKIAVVVLLVLNVMNIAAFAVLVIIGLARGVSEPFPLWFNKGREVCFFLGCFLIVTSLPFIAYSQQKNRAVLSLFLALGTEMVIGYLTERG